MEELKIGKITTEELASWFYTTKKNLSKHKKDFLKILKEYCEFESVYGGIIVNKIYKSTYIKNPNYKIVLDNIDKAWAGYGLDTCSHVGSVIYEEHKDELTVQESTTIKHTAQARNQKWGKPGAEEGGLQGKCWYVLCKKNKNGVPIYLTSEQEQIKKELLKKWFGSADEKTIIVQTMIDNKEITKEEGWETYSRLMKLPKSYTGFMKEFKEKTGIQLIRGTQIENYNAPWEERKDF